MGAAVERKRPMTKEDIQKKNLIKLINLMIQENEEQYSMWWERLWSVNYTLPVIN